MRLSNPISTEILPLAFGTVGSLPDAVEVFGGGIDQLGVVGEDTGLKVAVVVAFHTDAGTSEVGGADIGYRAVENHYLEMHTRAEPPLQLAPQSWIFVEIGPEVLARFFSV